MPDLGGKVAIVTGANSGIGFASARALAARGALVILACRNAAKGKAAVQQIRLVQPSAKVELQQLDLADLGAIRKFSDDFKDQYARLDILINNAGVMYPPFQTTAQGFESQFGINYLGHFALTGLLFDRILTTAAARVVNVSSIMHRYGRIEFNNFNAQHGYHRYRAYFDSKLANLLFTYELQRLLIALGSQVIAVAAHPGWAATNLQGNAPLLKAFNANLAQSSEMGALPSLYAACAVDVQGGKFYGPDGFQELFGYPKEVRSSVRSHDRELAARLWAVSEELSEVKFQAFG